MEKEILLGKTLQELEEIVVNLNMPKFTARQITSWLYKKRIFSIDEMSDISLKNREILKEHFDLGTSLPIHTSYSSDGTEKFLFATRKGKDGQENSIECVYIPEADRATLCVSAQCGCKMHCAFCATAQMGFQHQLSVHEILNQFYSIPHSTSITNFVFMGMGEPFDNLESILKALKILTADWGFGFSPHRITVSSVGVIPGVKRFLEESECHLAISLHNPYHLERQEIMPSEKAYPIHELVELLRQYDWSHQRRLSFEYILLKGMNDSMSHAKALLKLLKGLECRINLIGYHEVKGLKFQRVEEPRALAFRDYLSKQGLFTSIRKSRGEDILAACGLLAKTHKDA